MSKAAPLVKILKKIRLFFRYLNYLSKNIPNSSKNDGGDVF